ncbi:uncharacterized protein [Leptinotarsa decemlineata]|uniref:uncharacterized protein n=1 Tax=Leptinotarsa decemlineata TaxID=7539 RepID=UPI003D3093D7
MCRTVCKKTFGKLMLVIVFLLVMFVFCGSMKQIILDFSDMKCDMPCGDPKPRVLLIRELVGLGNKSQTTPYMAIFHRCEESGCCKTQNVCFPLEIQTITIKYYDHTNRDDTVKFKNVTNHTNCSCQIPKR